MTTMRDAKILGGIGAILSLLSLIPRVGIVFSIVGLVLVLVAVKYISDIVREPKIFKDVLIAVIAQIIGTVVFSLVVPIALLGIFMGMPRFRPGFAISLTLGGVIVAFIVMLACFIMGALLIKRSYYRIAELTGVNLFKTTGLLYLIGAILVIVLVGAIVLFVAKILEAISFFSLPETYPPPPPPS